jgi:hypothetical protein
MEFVESFMDRKMLIELGGVSGVKRAATRLV